MSDLGRTPPGPGAPPSAVEEQLAADRQALIEQTGRGLWPLSRTERVLKDQRASSRAAQEEGGRIMSAVNRLRTRPRLFSGLIGAALIGGVLLLPISYQRTVGHDVTLEVSTGGQPMPLPGLAAGSGKWFVIYADHDDLERQHHEKQNSIHSHHQ